MTLLALMYHRASLGRYGNPAALLDEHFSVLARHYHCVLPGEPLVTHTLNICLTFDDAYFDFYTIVLPLLRKHELRAVLAVPISAIHERTEMTAALRLKACSRRVRDSHSPGGHCTWAELGEVAASGSIAIAAHGFTHARLDRPTIDLHTEIVIPQTMLAARTGQTINTFVLPFGRFNHLTIQYARRHYRYVFRIGGADNESWDQEILYRIDADEMTSPKTLFSPGRLATYRLRRHWNRIRAR